MSAIMDAQHEKNLAHALDPKRGDYWQEMLTPICVVIDVSKFTVVVCDKVVRGKGGWMWDFSSPFTVYTRKDFSNRYRYGAAGNDAFESTNDDTDIKNHFWCDVRPEAHLWAADHALEEAS